MTSPRDAVTLAITGASGAPYALRLLECLLAAGETVYLLTVGGGAHGDPAGNRLGRCPPTMPR
jgi:hypothetical protein